MNTDPLTGRPLPPTAIQRVLYLAPKVHVYQIPPATSTKGYQASTWTTDPKRQIFTARLRVVETSIPRSSLSANHPALASRTNTAPTSSENGDDEDEVVTTTLLLEDPATGDLFAAAPYTSPVAVEQALDSSRFFAITVAHEGRKAVLGMGFEERSEAFDFSIALQDARRVLGFDKSDPQNSAQGRGRNATKPAKEEPKRDFSLKEGETISINLGGLKGRRARPEGSSSGGADPWATTSSGSETDALFSIKPPPGPGGASATPFLPPPPSAKSVKEERRRSRQTFEEKSAQDLGFDDGEFGEFQ